MWKLLVSSLVASTIAVPLNVVHERRGSGSNQKLKVSNIDRNAVIPVRIGLTQRNLDRGYDHVMDVSDPDSANYGKHWNLDQVNAEFAPSDETVALVTEWLEKSGIENSRQTSNKGWIAFDAPIHQVEKLFNTQYREYTNQDGMTRIGCDEYSLPQHLTPHIDYITPAVKMSPPVQRSKSKRSASADQPSKFGPAHRQPPIGPYIPPAGGEGLPPDLVNCGVNITPPCYRALYNIPAPGNFNIASGQIGVFEDGDIYSQADLDDYFTTYAPYVPNGTHPVLYGINNATAPVPQDEAGGESDLDFSIVYSLLGAANVSLYQTQNPINFTYYSENVTLFDPFLDAIDGSFCSDYERENGFQCGAYPLSTVISASYQTPELFYQNQASQIRVCNEFMKLSLQGHTIVFSSGDYGVASNPGFGEALCVANGCIAQDLNNTGYNAYTGLIFSPGFPSNCPYTLSVGGTQLLSNQTVYDPESVMNVPGIGLAGCPKGVTFSSGGGFANYFSRPSYQDTVVQNYLDNFAPNYTYYESNLVDVEDKNTTIGQNKGIYNRNGRAIPDVSANGAYALFYNGGLDEQFFGTSLATPIWASIITMLNSERAAAGQPSVGFIHPTLYKNPQVFNDITIGNNAGCNTTGFPAVKGWDPSSGLGTPNYTKLSALFKNVPNPYPYNG